MFEKAAETGAEMAESEVLSWVQAKRLELQDLVGWLPDEIQPGMSHYEPPPLVLPPHPPSGQAFSSCAVTRRIAPSSGPPKALGPPAFPTCRYRTE